MEAYRTEEEQLEVLRRWWREQGRMIVLAVAVAVIAVFGYRAWSQHQQGQQEEVARLYQSLLTADQQLGQPGATEDQLRTARHLARSLREDHGRSVYGRFGALFEARYALQLGQPGEARQALSWVMERSPGDGLDQLARLRLAQLHYGADELDQALAVLEGGELGSLRSASLSLQGDIHYARGDREQARQSWQQAAMAAAQLVEPARDPVLQLKLDDVAPPEDSWQPADLPGTQEQ